MAIAPKSQKARAKTDGGIAANCRASAGEGNSYQNKERAAEWEKTFANHAPGGLLMSTIRKEH